MSELQPDNPAGQDPHGNRGANASNGRGIDLLNAMFGPPEFLAAYCDRVGATPDGLKHELMHSYIVSVWRE